MKTGIIILRPIGSEMNKVVIDQTFGTAELLLFGSAQMTEPFSAEHRTFFFTVHCIFQHGYSELSIKRTGFNKRTGGKILSK